MTDGPIDQTVYRELQDATGADFVDELVDTFLEEAPAMIAELGTALDHGDADGFRRAAHSIKSNANVFGAYALAELARQMEHAGPDFATDRTAIDALEQAYTQAADALLVLRNG